MRSDGSAEMGGEQQFLLVAKLMALPVEEYMRLAGEIFIRKDWAVHAVRRE